MTTLPMHADEWEVRTVDSLGSVHGGKRLPKGRVLSDIPTPHPYIRVTDMHPGGVDTSELRYVPADVAPFIRAYRIFQDDIFISVAGTLGIVGRIPAQLDGANLTENADRITSINCDVDYLMYSLLSEPIQREIDAIRTVGAQPKLALGRIKQFEVSIPKSRREQEQVVNVLGDIDKTIATLERVIAKKQAIKQGMMQQLLTGRILFRGSLASGDDAPLGAITTWLSGGTPDRNNPTYWNGAIPWISAATLKRSRVHDSDQHLTEAGVRAGSKLAPAGATLVLVRGMALHRETRIAMATRPISFNQDVKALIPKLGVMPEYLLYALQARSPQVLDLVSSAGSGTGVLNTQLLQRLPIWVPDEATQRRIVTAVDSVDRNIDILDRYLVKVRAIKQGMMQQLLTGRTRLPAKEGLV
jgi:type I restriction enzyme, S subunit